MRVVVTGATGTIGLAVVAALRGRGEEVVALTRDPGRARGSLPAGVEAVAWPDPQSAPAPAAALGGADAVVHLLGEPIAQRWTQAARHEILNSRVLGTRNLVAGLGALEGGRPGVLVSQSGVDLYGPRGDERLDESAPEGESFPARVVAAWEAEARRAAELGIRVVTTRTGMVLSDAGGALEKMLPFFKLGVGGPVAGGRQYVSWIHLDDVVGGILFCLDEPAVNGPVNLTAPEPATNRELSRALGRVLRRPAVIPVPGFVLKLLYGDMASMVTTGRRAVPAALERLGYSFGRPELEAALRDATGR